MVVVVRTVAGAASGQLPMGPESVLQRLLLVLHHMFERLLKPLSHRLTSSQCSVEVSMQAIKSHGS